MGLVDELKFLEKDRRFESILSKHDEKQLEWFFGLDKFIRAEINRLIDLVMENRLGDVYNLLENLEDALNKEIRFLGKMRTFAYNSNLQAEIRLLSDAMKKIVEITNLLRDVGTDLAEIKQKDAKAKLEEVKRLL